MFTIDLNGDLVGYSIWDADPYYSPLVGCYSDGRLEHVAACDRLPERVGLDGPTQRCWFRMAVSSHARELLTAGDPRVRVLRCEDAMPLTMAGATPQPVRHVDDFLTIASRSRTHLTGFPAFLAAPAIHQLDILFLDYLDRLPDPAAREHYLDKLNSGWTCLSLRSELLQSEEFRLRRMMVSRRLGALVTSPIWSLLDKAEALGETGVALREYRLSNDEQGSDDVFVASLRDLFCDTCKIDTEELQTYCREHGREALATMLIREAAVQGRFVVLATE